MIQQGPEDEHEGGSRIVSRDSGAWTPFARKKERRQPQTPHSFVAEGDRQRRDELSMVPDPFQNGELQETIYFPVFSPLFLSSASSHFQSGILWSWFWFGETESLRERSKYKCRKKLIICSLHQRNYAFHGPIPKMNGRVEYQPIPSIGSCTAVPLSLPYLQRIRCKGAGEMRPQP